MADNVQLDAGTGGIYSRTKERTATIHNQVVEVNIGGATEAFLTGDANGAEIQGGSAHDGTTLPQPVLIGAKAVSALPTAVATADLSQLSSDLWGRQLVSHIDPGMQVWKSYNATAAKTGEAVWTPTSGKKIAITYLAMASYGTTAARCILWFGGSADTAYTAGTDQLVLAASMVPMTTGRPGIILQPPSPIYCTTADYILRFTSDAAISIDIAVYGYEW